MIAVALGVIFWIPCTYIVLPWIHEQTPLAYGVTTVALVLLVLEMRQIGMSGFILPKAPPAIPLDSSTRFQPQPTRSSAAPYPPDQEA